MVTAGGEKTEGRMGFSATKKLTVVGALVQCRVPVVP